MAGRTQGYKIAQLIGFFIIGINITNVIKISEGNDVVNIQVFTQMITIYTAALAFMTIACKRSSSLAKPIGTIISDVSSFPSRRLITGPMPRPPFSSAFIGTKIRLVNTGWGSENLLATVRTGNARLIGWIRAVWSSSFNAKLFISTFCGTEIAGMLSSSPWRNVIYFLAKGTRHLYFRFSEMMRVSFWAILFNPKRITMMIAKFLDMTALVSNRHGARTVSTCCLFGHGLIIKQ